MNHDPRNQNRKLRSKVRAMRIRRNPFLENVSLYILLFGILTFISLVLMHFHLPHEYEWIEYIVMR